MKPAPGEASPGNEVVARLDDMTMTRDSRPGRRASTQSRGTRLSLHRQFSTKVLDYAVAGEEAPLNKGLLTAIGGSADGGPLFERR
jgi:hypothetical protein